MFYIANYSNSCYDSEQQNPTTPQVTNHVLLNQGKTQKQPYTAYAKHILLTINFTNLREATDLLACQPKLGLRRSP